MFTQCPNCETIFAIRREQLEVRQGLVRCGRCREVFNASWNLIDRLPDAELAAAEARPLDELEPAPPREPPRAEHPPQRSESPSARAGEAALMQALSGLLEPTPRAADTRATAARPDSVPTTGARAAGRRRRSRRRGKDAEAAAPAARWLDFTAPLATTTRRSGLLWSLVALVLLAALGWQVRTFYLADLAAVAPLRPLLAGFCRLSGCALPPRQDLGRIELVDTGVLPHPDTPGALRVSATFVNRADFAQSYPLVQVTLTDKIGNIVGRRAYPPREYLIPGRRDLTMLTPNVVEVVSLDLANPHEKAVGYEIELVAAPPG